MIKNRTILVAILLVAILTAGAQNRECKLPTVDKSGYYNIALSPQIIGASGDNLHDIRIIDDAGNQTPYFIPSASTAYSYEQFEPYQYTLNHNGTKTEIVIEVSKTEINYFDLEVKNAQLDKQATLSGSNDKKSWYAVKDRVHIPRSTNTNQTTQIVSVDFPLSDYKYYLLTIDDSLSAPLYIEAIGNHTRHSHYWRRQVAVGSSLEISTKERKTNILVTYDKCYPLTGIELYVSGPAYFKRTINLSSADRFSISHDEQRPIRLGVNYRTDTLQMTIENLDDQPLVIDSILSYIDRRSLIAKLEQGTSYKLTFGDKSLSAPQYDLSFVNHLPDTLPSIATVDLDIAVKEEAMVEQTESSGWLSIVMWVVIVLVIAQIIYIVIKTARRVNSKEQ